MKTLHLYISIFLLATWIFAIIGYSQTFTKITAGAIVNDGGNSRGCSWGDYDDDGDLDLFVANWQESYNFLYANNGEGTFTKITSGIIVTDYGSSYGGAWGDYDNDGDLDLFVVNFKGEDNFLYSNTGNGTFTKITNSSIVNDGGYSRSAAWGDYDNDGFLDLFVANGNGENNYLYHNEGDSYFTKMITGDIVNNGGNSVGCSWGDCDNDNDLDLFVANGDIENDFLYINNGDGTFTKVINDIVVNDGKNSQSGSWGDYDNDGDLDLFVSTKGDQQNLLYANHGDGTFEKITTGPIVTEIKDSRGASWGDYDNDGDLDLFLSNWDYQSNFLYLNNGNGGFTKVTTGIIVNEPGSSCASISGDYDNDGDLDLFVTNGFGENNCLYANDGNNNHWISVKCIGTLSNYSGIGTKIKVKATINGSEIWQMQEIASQTGYSCENSLIAEFGLGDAAIIDLIRIEWPSGIVQDFNDVPVNQILTITESSTSTNYIHVSIPTEFAFPGDTIQVPVNVQFPPDSTFSSAQLNIGEYINHLEFLGVITDSSLIGEAGWSYQANENDSLLLIWMAGSQDISGSGVLLWFKFAIPDTITASFIPITLESAVFNTGNIPVVLSSGGVSILVPFYGDVDLNGAIQAFDASLILKYLVGIVNLNPQQMLNADVSLDSTVSALDASLILQYGVSLIDTLPYDSTGLFLANGSIMIEDQQIQPGEQLFIPVMLQDGENILSFSGSVVFDPQVLTFEGIVWPPSFSNFMKDVCLTEEGYCMAASGTNPVSYSGVFATLKFKVNENFTGNSTTVSIQSWRWNEEGVISNATLGTLTNLQSPDHLVNQFWLKQNYPNPFNPQTTIDYHIPRDGKVKIVIYNSLGQKINTLLSGEQMAGSHLVVWDGTNDMGQKVGSGIYFYLLNFENRTIVKQMILLR